MRRGYASPVGIDEYRVAGVVEALGDVGDM